MGVRLILLFSMSFFLFQFVSGKCPFCENNTQITRRCTTQIKGKEFIDAELCKVEYIPSNSPKCLDNFGPISSNYKIGQVILKPYNLLCNCTEECRASTATVCNCKDTVGYSLNYTVLNISFTNIKWKTMKFRFQIVSAKYTDNYCRNIVISNNVSFDDQSVLYHDCYWLYSNKDVKGNSRVLDFEATDDDVVNRGKIYFNIPTAEMLEPTSEEKWKPFVYVEILTNYMKLHIMPPPQNLNITTYQIDVKRKCDEETQCDEIVESKLIQSENNTQEVTSEYRLLVRAGSYYFVVTPKHEKCMNGESICQQVESPLIFIDSEVRKTVQNCIASIASLVIGAVFVYLLVIWCIRRRWCKDYNQEIPSPTKVLVIYSPTNRLHAACVGSFVSYLRSECGFDVLFDGDISNTTHGDPFVWAEEAFKQASHVIYVVGPTENTNLYNNIYDKPIIVYKDVDILLLSLLRNNRTSRNPKQIMNVFFDHSNGTVPIETRHDKKFILLRDWQKLIAHLSKNLLPKKQIMRSKEGKMFLDNLSRANELSNARHDDIRFDKNITEKKVLL